MINIGAIALTTADRAFDSSSICIRARARQKAEIGKLGKAEIKNLSTPLASPFSISNFQIS
jgi:hypothetical protein